MLIISVWPFYMCQVFWLSSQPVLTKFLLFLLKLWVKYLSGFTELNTNIEDHLIVTCFCFLCFVFCVFILVDTFSGSMKTEKTQKIFLPWQKIISAKENFCALAWTLAKFCLRGWNGQSRAGSIAPSCPLG